MRKIIGILLACGEKNTYVVTGICLPRPSAITRQVILTAVLQLGGYVGCNIERTAALSKRALLRFPLRLGLPLCSKTLEE